MKLKTLTNQNKEFDESKNKRKRKYKFTSKDIMTSCFQAVITSTIRVILALLV